MRHQAVGRPAHKMLTNVDTFHLGYQKFPISKTFRPGVPQRFKGQPSICPLVTADVTSLGRAQNAGADRFPDICSKAGGLQSSSMIYFQSLILPKGIFGLHLPLAPAYPATDSRNPVNHQSPRKEKSFITKCSSLR